jgi:hypothetical protein
MISITNKLSMAARRASFAKEPVVMRVLSLRSREVIVYDLPKRKRAAAVTAIAVTAVPAPSAVVLNARTQLMVELQDVQQRMQLNSQDSQDEFVFAMADDTCVDVDTDMINVLVASSVQRRINAVLKAMTMALCFSISNTSQDFSLKVLVHDSKRAASRRPTAQELGVSADLLNARTQLMVEIQDAGRKIEAVKAAAVRESVKKIRVELMQQLLRSHTLRTNKLESKERSNIKWYSGCGFADINNELRTGAVSSKEQERIRFILKAMAKAVLPVHRGTVYRGTNLSQPMMDDLRPGATFCDPAFLSTTKLEAKAFRGSVIFRIESKSGVDISSMSRQKNEAEVLFRPGTMFKILSVTSVQDSSEVCLEVAMEELY